MHKRNSSKSIFIYFLPLTDSSFLFQLGGTIGDIEGMPFVEAFRQFQFKAKRENFCNIHVSLVPQVNYSNYTHSINSNLYSELSFVFVYFSD